MTKRCVVCGEKFHYNSEFNFHVFPQDETMRRKWLEALNLAQMQISRNVKVCSKHFPKNSYYRANNETIKRKLRRDAVPRLENSHLEIETEVRGLSDANENKLSNERVGFIKSESAENGIFRKEEINEKEISVKEEIFESVFSIKGEIVESVVSVEEKIYQSIDFIKKEKDESVLPTNVNISSKENVIGNLNLNSVNNENDSSFESVDRENDRNLNLHAVDTEDCLSNRKNESDLIRAKNTSVSRNDTKSKKGQRASFTRQDGRSKNKVRFIKDKVTYYICREDFVSEEAWKRFLSYTVYQRAKRIAAQSKNCRIRKQLGSLKNVVEEMEKSNLGTS